MRRPVRAAVVAVPLSLLVTATLAAPSMAAGRSPDRAFALLTTFEVPGEGGVAEIMAVTPDGRTLLYTDSQQEQVGVVDLRRPQAPVQVGAVPVGGEPTSVGVTKDGRYALVSVDTSESAADPSGHLAVVDLRTLGVVRELDLAGQPDSVAVSPRGDVAAIAVENERDEELEVDGVEGGLPQPPAGHLAVVELGGQPSSWSVDLVDLTGLDGALYADDPEPEYVDIDAAGTAAVTLQENNAIALVDLGSRQVLRSFSAGEVVRTDADVEDDGVVAFDDPLTAPREPDAVQWTPDGNLLTADEGDLAEEPSGGRGWTVFSPTGEVVSSSGAGAEQALAAAGRYPDGRSDDKGAELEGAEVASLLGGSYAFLGAERGDAVLVYRFEDESAPRLVEVLPTGDAPEGLLAVQRQGLFLASNEDDGTISVFRARAGR